MYSILTGRKPNRVAVSGPAASELHENCDIVKDVITSLMKTSIIIRDATPRDRYVKAATTTRQPFSDLFDIAHVGQKFPRLDVEGRQWLKERLGKAITQRREYLRYCREHHDKFLDLNSDKVSSSQMLPQVDSPLVKTGLKDRAGTVRSLPASAFASTEASTLQTHRLKPFKERFTAISEDLFDSNSHTSYATSVHDNEGEGKISPPSLKDIATTFPFECPYCWSLQEVKNEKAWR